MTSRAFYLLAALVFLLPNGVIALSSPHPEHPRPQFFREKWLNLKIAEKLVSLASTRANFVPGAIWPDNQGVHINAHGGGIIHTNGRYYWFGEYKTGGPEGNTAMVGVSCYSSENLYEWKNEGIVLSVSDDTTSVIRKSCVIERPKVIFNKATGKFVMWFHHELFGQGYRAAMSGIAVADAVTGPYTYIRSIRPNAGSWPINVQETHKRAVPASTKAHYGGGPGGGGIQHLGTVERTGKSLSRNR